MGILIQITIVLISLIHFVSSHLSLVIALMNCPVMVDISEWLCGTLWSSLDFTTDYKRWQCKHRRICEIATYDLHIILDPPLVGFGWTCGFIMHLLSSSSIKKFSFSWFTWSWLGIASNLTKWGGFDRQQRPTSTFQVEPCIWS